MNKAPGVHAEELEGINNQTTQLEADLSYFFLFVDCYSLFCCSVNQPRSGFHPFANAFTTNKMAADVWSDYQKSNTYMIFH